MGFPFDRRDESRSGALGRRAMLAGVLAVAVSACTAAARRAALGREPEPLTSSTETSTTTTTTPPPTTTTVAASTTTTSLESTTTVASPPTTFVVPAGLPVHAVPVRAKPVYRVTDYQPRAPRNAVALTIDDGPDPRWTPAVLAELAHNHVKATFCVVGVHVARYPGLVRQIVAGGHSLCNHTMTHRQPFTALTPARIDAEIMEGTLAIYRATRVLPNVFRSPGGDWNESVLKSCARMGQVPIDWDVDPRDWSRPGTTFITERLLAARPGDILLCHDGGGDRSETVASLRTVLPALKKRGLTFVTL